VHSKNPEPCSPGEPEEEDGYSVSQAKMLRSRKGIKGMTEVERWNQTYRILFPDCDVNSMPSSCKTIFAVFHCYTDQNLVYYDDQEQEFRRLVKFKDFLKDELPRKLYEDMASDTEPPPKWLQLRIAILARRATEKAFEAYQRPPASPPQTSIETLENINIESAIPPESTPTCLIEPSTDMFSASRGDMVIITTPSMSTVDDNEMSMQSTEEAAFQHTNATTTLGKQPVNDSFQNFRHQNIDEFSVSSLPDFDFDLDQWQVPKIFK
jgi:hypothetical protein